MNGYNTGAAGSGVPTSEMYVVLEGTQLVQYAPVADLDNLTTYLDLSSFATEPLVGLAVEDVAPRGVWSTGDVVIFSEEDSSVIQKFSFGGVPATLTANGVSFDGTAMLDFGQLEDGEVINPPQFSVGNITALAVASVSGSQITPTDRTFVDFVEPAGPSPIPTASEWGLVVMALIVLVAGAIILGRRQVARA